MDRDHEVPEPRVLRVFRKAYPYTDGLGPVAVPDDSKIQQAVPRFGMVPVIPCLREDEDDGRWIPGFTYSEHAHGEDWRWLVEAK